MKLSALIPVVFSLIPSLVLAATTEITIDLKLDNLDYVTGERIRGVVDVANASPNKVSYGYLNSEDSVFVEVFRSNGMLQMEQTSDGRFVSPFRVDSNEGQKLETFLGDHYGLGEPGKYLAKPVLVHNGVRFEGQLRAFSVVPGMKVSSALQMFKNVEGLSRVFELRTWSRKNKDHLFLVAHDEGVSDRGFVTTDLGPMMKLYKPRVTVKPTGEVIVLHRFNRDQYLRTEFWSLPKVLEFQRREAVGDPETAGSDRVRELYKDSGGVKPKAKPWYKFW